MALGLGALAAAGVFFYVNSVQQQAAEAERAAQQAAARALARTKVVVAKVNVPAKTLLSPNLFEVREVPTESVLAGAITNPADLQGKVLSTPIAAGEQIPANRVQNPDAAEAKRFADLIPPGKRALSVAFSESLGSAGFIVPGDYVDVLAVFKRDTLGKDQAMMLLQDVMVLAVGQATSLEQLPLQGGVPTPTPQPRPQVPGQPAPPPPTPTPPRVPVAPPGARILTLAVDPEAAERLALAEDYAARLRYVARPSGERSQSAVVPADLATLASPLVVASAQIVASEISPTNVQVGGTLNVKITIKNTSDKPLQTMGPQPGFAYVQGQTYFTQQFASQPGKWRVAVGSAGLDATELPYRWGFGGDLAPGASTTVTGSIKVTQDFKPTNFWAAIVEEPAKVVQNGVGLTLVTSQAENLAIVAVDAANVRSGPSIASSVVDQVKYGTELEIIGQSADWFKVRLPDKREAWVAAGWIVTAGR